VVFYLAVGRLRIGKIWITASNYVLFCKVKTTLKLIFASSMKVVIGKFYSKSNFDKNIVVGFTIVSVWIS